MSSSPKSFSVEHKKEESQNTEEEKEETIASPLEEGENDDEEQEETEENTDKTESDAAQQWQAIWSPDYNAYYFFNAATQQTTWTNPLVPDASQPQDPAATATSEEDQQPEPEPEPESSSSAQQPPLSRIAAEHAAIQAAAIAQGIDPLLARLDPSLVASATAPGVSGVPGSLPTFTAQFNARTGRFTASSLPSSSGASSSTAVRTPAHLSEYERAKRMSSFYFDVDKWEEDLAKRGGRLMGEEGAEGEDVDEAGKKRKRPSKKDIERFKEQKKQKKMAKTAWLRT